MMYPDEEIRLLCARLSDLQARAERGDCACSPFLTPREQHFGMQFCREQGLDEQAFLFGGCPGTERNRIVIAPAYLAGFDREQMLCALAEPLAEAVCTLRISGSGFARRELTHRDYLGALLACGIVRESLGDIVPDGAGGVYLFCDRTVGRYLCETLSCVGSDHVTVAFAGLPADFCVEPSFVPVGGTVASARLDCMVAELTGLSREKAQNAVRTGLCELEYACVDKPDREIVPPAYLSVRGYGKFIIRSIGPATKKGRLRFQADRYR